MVTSDFLWAPLTIGAMRLGAWGAQLSASQLRTFVEECMSLNLRDFDHADIYGDYTTEREFGAVLQGQSALRDQLQLITKCGIKLVGPNRPEHRIKSYDSSGSHIIHSVEQSLINLNTDRIDLLLLHRLDYLLDPHEVADTFEQLKAAGKVRFFGVSNFSPSQFALLRTFTPLVTNQIEASLVHLDPFGNGTLDQCLQYDIRPMAWSPLGGGALFTTTDDARVNRIRAVGKRLAEAYEVTLDQLLLAWLLRHPSNLVPVLGTTRIERVRAAHQALSVELSRQDWYELWQASTGEEVL